MNDFLFKYMDLVTLFVTLGIVLPISYKAWKKSCKTTRLGVLPFLFLAPVLLMASMGAHLFEVMFHAIDSHFTGKFSLRFHLYSLILLGLVLGNAGIMYFQATQSFLFAKQPRRVVLLKPAALVALILFPLMWLTPLSFLMYVVCGISVGASFLVHKQNVPDGEGAMLTLREAAAS